METDSPTDEHLGVRAFVSGKGDTDPSLPTGMGRGKGLDDQPLDAKGLGKKGKPSKGKPQRSQSRVDREASQNLRSSLPLHLQAIPLGELRGEDGRAEREVDSGYSSLSKVLELLPRLSPSGLNVVKSSVENLLLPAGLSSRIGVQEALAARSSSAVPRLKSVSVPKGQLKSAGKASGKTAPKSTTKWKGLDEDRRKTLEQHTLLVRITADNSRLLSEMSQENHKRFRTCTSSEQWDEITESYTQIRKVGHYMALETCKIEIAQLARDAGNPS